MTKKQQAQLRNSKIMRLRGAASTIVHLIPSDIADKLYPEDIADLAEICDRVLHVLDTSKKIKVMCDSCSSTGTHKQIQDRIPKHYYKCDCCGVSGDVELHRFRHENIS